MTRTPSTHSAPSENEKAPRVREIENVDEKGQTAVFNADMDVSSVDERKLMRKVDFVYVFLFHCLSFHRSGGRETHASDYRNPGCSHGCRSCIFSAFWTEPVSGAFHYFVHVISVFADSTRAFFSRSSVLHGKIRNAKVCSSIFRSIVTHVLIPLGSCMDLRKISELQMTSTILRSWSSSSHTRSLRYAARLSSCPNRREAHLP
jgi:hypothetical protein